MLFAAPILMRNMWLFEAMQRRESIAYACKIIYMSSMKMKFLSVYQVIWLRLPCEMGEITV